MDSAMYGIQSMLVNLTRPMGQYVHNKLRMEPNTDILNNRDLKHNLKMREMIADIAAHITQLRIEHSSLAKAYRQPVGQEHCREGVKNSIQAPQYATANFESLIKESDDQLERVFGADASRSFNNFTKPKVNTTPKPIQEKNYIGSKRYSDNGSGNSSLKESHRRSKSKNSGALQSTICNTKENRGTQTSPGPEKTQLSCRREKLQDVVTTKKMPDHTQKGLHGVSELRRCIYAYYDTSNMQEVSKVYLEWESIPIQSSFIWAAIKSTYVHQNSETNNYTSGNNYKYKKYDGQGTSIQGKRLTQRSFKTNKDKADNSKKSGKLYRKGTGYANSTATGTIDVETSPRIKK
ncbi:hypothetical protein BB561_006424 [Smittium simulii]|uniref:Uncharacterized protein n=1 Tax=Smittium simulii TaxID=133385 RepID=A0A2T9Y4G8_9FUNG|nr:hypothetical protein BB561_006424 [Smittium simulii]